VLVSHESLQAVANLLGGATGHFFNQLNISFDGAGNGVAEITVNTAALFAAQMSTPGAHTHELPIFGKAEALGSPLMGFQFWHDSPLLWLLESHGLPLVCLEQNKSIPGYLRTSVNPFQSNNQFSNWQTYKNGLKPVLISLCLFVRRLFVRHSFVHPLLYRVRLYTIT